MAEWTPGNLEWLKSRRGVAYQALLVELAKPAKLFSEIKRLHGLVLDFDLLIQKEEAFFAALEKPKKPAKAPTPIAPNKRTAETLRRAEVAKMNAERRRRGLIPAETEEEQAIRLPPPELPVPVVELSEEKQADHLIADDVARRASVMIAHGYSFGRRRSRRYEGLR